VNDLITVTGGKCKTDRTLSFQSAQPLHVLQFRKLHQNSWRFIFNNKYGS